MLFDLRSAIRSLCASPWGSLAAALTLAVGLGGALAVLVVAYAVLLRPLPFPSADRLVVLDPIFPATGSLTRLTTAQLEDLAGRVAAEAALTGYTTEAATIRAGDAPAEVTLGVVADGFFQVLGTAAWVGRAPSDHGSPDEVAVSAAFARRLTGRNVEAAIGRAVELGGRQVRVIGVMPDAFGALDENVSIWIAGRALPARTPFGGAGGARYYRPLARLAAGVTPAGIRSQAERALRSSTTMTPSGAAWRVDVHSLTETLLGDVRPVLEAVIAAALLLLLTACANVATLLVGRAVARTRESAVRLALGATSARLLRTTFFEAFLLAAGGAAAGYWLARLAIGIVQTRVDTALPRLSEAPAGPALALLTAAAAVVVAAVCALAPALALRQARVAPQLRDAATTGSRATRRLRSGLVAAQLATAVVLLTAAGLLGRTVIELAHADLGLADPTHVLTLRLPFGQFIPDARARASAVDDVLSRVRRLPGVTSAGVGSALPPNVPQVSFIITVETNAARSTRTFDLVSATDGYLDALGARLEQGRVFDDDDTLRSESVAVLSDTAAKHLAPLGHPLDRVLNMQLPTAEGPRQKPRVVGVVDDVRYNGLDADRLGGVYVLWRQLPMASGYLVVRTAGTPAALAPEVADVVRAAAPALPIEPPQTLDQVIGGALSSRTTRFALVGVFAAAALLLAVVGLSASLVRAVVERRRELAVRAALGATPQRLVRLVLVQGAWLTGLGAAAGAAGAIAASRLVGTLVYGVSLYDPWSYGAAIGAVATVSLIACYVPARRAAAIDPVVLLKSE